MTTIVIPTVTTPRLCLRAPRFSDFDAYAEFRCSDRAKMLGGPFTRTQAFDQLAEIIGHWHLRGYGRWLVADNTTDEPLGIVGLYFPHDWPEPEIAWSVFARGEGRGIAAEAAKTSRNYAYETLGWSTAISLIDPENTRSIKLAQRLGATYDKIYKHPDMGDMHIWRHPAPEDLT